MEYTSSRKVKAKEYKILAGEMKIVEGKVKPNADKGEIRFYVNRDQLLNFEWRNLDKNITTEALVIFENEWEWKKVQTMKGRVYILQNKSFAEDKFYFWMQYPNKAEDEVNENIISNILSTGILEIDETLKGDKNHSGVESIMKNEEKNESNNVNSGNNRAGNMDFIKNLANAMKNVEKVKYPTLGKILTNSNMNKVLDEKSIENLIK